jgi:regulatory protein
MIITKITVQVKNPSRYSIFIDGKYTLSMSDIALLDLGLKVGQQITAEELKEIEESSVLDKYYQKTLNLISLRPRSSKEIHDYLKRNDCPTPKIEIILNKLTKNKYINDQAFAESWIRNRLLLKPSSLRKLKLELRQKGINNEMIEKAIVDLEADDTSTLIKLIDKKRKLTKYRDDNKLTQYLISQGFNYYDVKNCLG